MRVDPKGILAGRPIRQVRDLLRRVPSGTSFRREFVVKILGEPDATDALLAAGLIELDHSKDEKIRFKATDDGIRLASTNLVPRITRAKAETIMADFMRRVAEINANPELISRVAEVYAFGSYITNAPEIGDIDLAVVFERKLPGEEWTQRGRQRADATGRRFSFLAASCYGENEVMRILKARSRYLTFAELSTLEKQGWPRKRIHPPETTKPRAASDQMTRPTPI
jgi:hypothetical protein